MTAAATLPLADWTTFVDPVAIAIVVGGTLVAMLLRGPFSDSRAAFAALKRIWRPGFDADAVRAELARVERIAATRGLLAVDPAPVRDRAVSEAVAAIVDGCGAEAVLDRLDRADADRARRHAVVHSQWAAAAEIAPAMGMIGTLAGLVRMFSRMDDPQAIGGAMAVALLTTLYGAVLANLVAAPIAARLARLSAAEAVARQTIRQPLADFARRAAAPARRQRSAA